MKSVFLILLAAVAWGATCPGDHTKVYLSPCGSDGNSGLSTSAPVHTFPRAVDLSSSFSKVCFLLQSNATFTEFPVMYDIDLTNYDPYRNKYALIWNSHRPLMVTTYDGSEKALLLSGCYTDPGPQMAIGIVNGGPVTIDNLAFERWEVAVLFTYESEYITFTNNQLQYIGTRYFPDETAVLTEDDDDDVPMYSAGALYLKNTEFSEVAYNTMTDIHNNPNYYWSSSHAMYFSRGTHVDCHHNYVARASGSPLKVRRSQSNNITIHHNTFEYTSPAEQEDAVQKGWLRYSGSENNCPYDIFIHDNTFSYPYCWSDCQRKSDDNENDDDSDDFYAIRYSESNPEYCPEDEGVYWDDNDFDYYYVYP